MLSFGCRVLFLLAVFFLVNVLTLQEETDNLSPAEDYDFADETVTEDVTEGTTLAVCQVTETCALQTFDSIRTGYRRNELEQICQCPEGHICREATQVQDFVGIVIYYKCFPSSFWIHSERLPQSSTEELGVRQYRLIKFGEKI